MATAIEDVIRRVQPWETVSQLVARRQSFLLFVPRHCYGSIILGELLRSVCNPIVRLNTRIGKAEGTSAQTGAFIRTFRKAVRSKRRRLIRNVQEMPGILQEEYDGAGLRTWLVEGGSFDNREFHSEVLEAMNGLLGCPGVSDSLHIIALDDGSSWFHAKRLNMHRSLLENLKLVSWSPFREKDIEAIFSDLCDHIDGYQSGNSPEFLFEMTGGHPGLVLELASELLLGKSIAIEEVRDFLKRGTVFAKLLEDLAAAPYEYYAAAMRHLEPRVDRNDAGADRLEELGVIARSQGGAQRVLISGIIRGAIETVAELSLEKPQSVRDKQKSSKGNNAVDAIKEWNWEWVTDSDILVLMLSDLHFGEKHAYRIETDGTPVNEEQPTLEEILLQDMKQLGIAKRIDGLGVLGDVTEGGHEIEFRRAEAFLEVLCNELSLESEHTFFIAGNHDVTWNPSALDQGPKAEKSARQWQAFLERKSKIPHALASRTRLLSRDNTRDLNIIGLDSNHAEGPQSGGIGWVSRRALEEAQQLLSNIEFTELWISVHHHLLPIANTPFDQAKARRVSQLANSVDVLGLVEDMNACCLIHGHCHQPSVLEMRQWSLEAGKSYPFLIVSSGSVGARRDDLGEIGHNQYYIVISRPDDIVVVSRRTGESRRKFVDHMAIVYERKK